MMIAILSMTRLMQEWPVSKTYLYVMSKAGYLTGETYFHDNQAFRVLVSMHRDLLDHYFIFHGDHVDCQFFIVMILPHFDLLHRTGYILNNIALNNNKI